jgi:hypothetical protein
MPYINKDDRKLFNHHIFALGNEIDTEGELNYVITKLAKEFLDKHGESYATYNTLIGALECAKLELYRRKIAKYEDGKADLNGDVY